MTGRPIPGADRMIHICLWHLGPEQVEDRKEHGAHRMKGIRKRNVRIMRQTGLCEYVQELFTLQI